MKIRKNITLSARAIAVGEKLAALHGTSLSGLVEKQFLASDTTFDGHYWSKSTRPISRPGDVRYEYLRKKHA